MANLSKSLLSLNTFIQICLFPFGIWGDVGRSRPYRLQLPTCGHPVRRRDWFARTGIPFIKASTCTTLLPLGADVAIEGREDHGPDEKEGDSKTGSLVCASYLSQRQDLLLQEMSVNVSSHQTVQITAFCFVDWNGNIVPF